MSALTLVVSPLVKLVIMVAGSALAMVPTTTSLAVFARALPRWTSRFPYTASPMSNLWLSVKIQEKKKKTSTTPFPCFNNFQTPSILIRDRPVLFQNDIEKERARQCTIMHLYFCWISFLYPLCNFFISWAKRSMEVERKSAILLLCEHASFPVLILSAWMKVESFLCL